MATVLHAAIFMGLYTLLNLRQFPAPYSSVVAQAFGNALRRRGGVPDDRVVPGLRRQASRRTVFEAIITVMAIAEDRRRLTTRLTVLRVSIGVAFGLLAGGFWFFQVVQHAQFKEMAENNHQRTLTLRAPRGIIYDRTGQLLVENRNSFNISIVREHTKDLDRTIRVLSHGDRRRRESRARDRRSPSPRAELSPDRRHPGCDAGAGGRGHGAAPRFRTARRDRAGSADAPVSGPGDGRAPDRLRRRSQRRSDAGRRRDDRIDRRPVRRRAGLQQAADGRGRRQARRRQQRRPRNPHARRRCRRCRAAACS